MGRRNRSFFGLVVVGCGALALYFWRNRRAVRAFLAPASDRVRDLVKRALRQQAESEQGDGKPREVITGLAAPEARPLSSLEQLLSWNPDDPAAADPDDPFCRTYNAPLMAPAPAPPGSGLGAGSATRAAGAGGGLDPARPRLLVCHDMMCGYLDDRWVQGAADPGYFRIWQWDQIDAFIYFSHHLVTLPPPGWIAAAHRNGVRVLGTFITEWGEGRTRCEALLATPASARAAADTLAALAAQRGFEGWLVNIENGLRRELVPNLVTFVGHLRARMAAVVGPQALVVWYDAITTEGRLVWQDGLTPLNTPFFDAADALFVNYRWGEGAPAAVAAAAGSRAAEVYLGVDVFGRGSYGGGKDNCPVALAAARSAGLSAALFAPGWVYEEFPRDTFEQRQEAFWDRIRAVWPSRPALLQRLPLATCFNGGAGRGVWLEGRRVSGAPWFNLSAQDAVAATTRAAAGTSPDPPPALPGASVGPATSPLIVRPTQQLAYCGGSCLALQLAPPEEAEAGAEGLAAPPPPTAAGGPWLHDLYSAHLPVPAAGLDLSYIVACAGASRVAVLLRTAPSPFQTASESVAPPSATDPRVGLAIGPWGPGDWAVVEALQREGYKCVTCPAAPTGATTSPLPELGATATVPAPTAAAAAAAAASAPAGLPWVTCSAHLPYHLFTGSAAGGSGGVAVITAVGVACFRTTAVAAAGPARGSSTTGYSAGTVAQGGVEGGDGTPYQAFLGRLSLREHRRGSSHHMTTGPAAPLEAAAAPAAAAAAAATEPPASGPLGLPLVAAPTPASPAPQLSGACCFRVRWGRPDGSRPRSLRASFTSLADVDKAAAPDAAVAPAAAIDPRVSGELVSSDVEDDEDWEHSSGGGNGGGIAGGSPVKVTAPGAAAAAEADDDGEEGDVTLGGGAGGDAEGARLLTCEVSWEPQFDGYGTPRHRSYHVWAHFSAAEAPAVAVGAVAAPTRPQATAAGGGRLPQVPSPAAMASPGAGVVRGGADDRESSSWEVLHPDWSGAVWAGEAFVARYRLVHLEVPGWARSVTLLAQPVSWEGAELAPQLQPLARLQVPQL